MDDRVLERARERLAEEASRRPRDADVGAALERTRAQLVQLSRVAAELESSLPGQVATAVQEGVRREASPVGRQLAEVRGLTTQILRRLEQLETDIAAERFARVDDLAVLVDLIGSGWKSVDDRLGRIERALGRREATVHRLVDRRTGVAQ
jgi:hypothetical protein